MARLHVSACLEAPGTWDGKGDSTLTFFKKAGNEKDQQLHGEEAVKDHL